MKLHTKILITISSILIIAGIVLVSVTFGIAKGDLSKVLISDPYEEKVISVKYDEIKNVILNDANKSINISYGNGDDVKVIYYENEKEYYNVSVDNRKSLKVDYITFKKWYHYIGIFNYQKTSNVELIIPKKYQGSLDVKTFNGQIEASNLNVKGNINLKTSNGAIIVEDINAANIDLKTTNGMIVVNGIKAKKDISLKTSNGAIVGTVIGKESDFKIQSETINGNNNLPFLKEDGNKNLIVKTSNGKIDIKFK